MNKKKDLSILARAARTLLIVMLLTITPQTAWAQTRYLTLDPNHSGSTECIIIPIEYDGNGYHYSLTNFNPANYPQFIRNNQIIIGWSELPIKPKQYDTNDIIYLTKDLTLYAIWNDTPEGCEVTFNANGGSGTMNAISVVGETEYTIPANGFSRDGYLFIGWATSADGGVVYRPEDKVTLVDDLELYAVWAKASCNVSFNANDGSGTMSAVTVAGGTEYTIPANGFSRDGYLFIGWATTADGGVVFHPNDKVTLVDDVELYAVWAKASCNVSFYANGGSGTMNAVSLIGGIEYTIPANGFSKDGYLFLGWATSADGFVVYQSGDKVTLTDDFSLYAVWGKEWSGSGTVDNPYQISEVANLLLLAQRVIGGTDYDGEYFKLMNDITFPHTTNWNAATSTENNFTAIGGQIYDSYFWVYHPFKGTFDGDGHTISGIRIYKGGNTDGDMQQGLFGLVNGGTVKNLTLADARITGYRYVGGIVGENYGTIENCHVLSNVAIHTVQSDANNHGGIVGYNSIGRTVSHCTSAATLSLGSSASGSSYGGIAGFNIGPLRDNLAIGVTIPAGSERGAIAGYGDNLQRNYYSGCTVGGATSGIGCGARYGDFNLADVTTNDGAVPAVILSESAAVPSPLSGKVVFRREFKQNVSSTICLPFGIDATQAAAAGKFFTFVGVDKTNPNDWIVTMQETAGNNMVEGALTANTPYLFKPAATGPVLFYGTAAATATAGKTPSSGHTGGWVFQGTYERINWSTDPQTIYGFAAPGKADLAEGKFFRVKGGSNSYILPFRAYLDAANGGASARGRRTPAESDLPDVMTVRLLSANGTPTAIGTLDTRTGEVRFDSDAWYSLDGRRLDDKPTKKGMYINKERKIIIK